MHNEIEVKFLSVDHSEIRNRLTKLGAQCIEPERVMRRILFDFPSRELSKKNHGRLRVRDEGDKITITYKQEDLSSQYSKEIETEVTSFEKMVELLKAIGLNDYSYQESIRETWLYDQTYIMLDQWPWIKPYIEIEGPSEPDIKACAEALQLDWKTAVYGSVDKAYRKQFKKMHKQESIGAVPEVRFNEPIPQWLKERA